jgi:hypothetical protein
MALSVSPFTQADWLVAEHDVSLCGAPPQLPPSCTRGGYTLAGSEDREAGTERWQTDGLNAFLQPCYETRPHDALHRYRRRAITAILSTLVRKLPVKEELASICPPSSQNPDLALLLQSQGVTLFLQYSATHLA